MQPVQRPVDAGPGVAGAVSGQGVPQLVEAPGGHPVGGDAGVQAVGRAQPGAGQRQVHADGAGQPWQEIAAAHVREQPDAGLRHGEQGALGRHPMRAVHRHPDPAAHGDAVHYRDIRLFETVDAVVERIFPAIEHRRQVAAAPAGVVQRPHVAAGAEGALAGALDDDDTDRGIGGAVGQPRVQRPDHRQGQRVERLRPVQGDRRDATAKLEQNFRIAIHITDFSH